MLNDNKKIKTEFWSVLTFNFVLFIVFGVFVYILFWVKIPNFKSLYSDILAGDNMDKKTADVLGLIENTKGDRAKLSSYFINKEAVVSFIEELESLSKQANVVLSIDPPLEEKDSPMAKQASLRFNVRAEGRFNDVMYFVRLVETLPYKIFVDHTVISSVDKVWTSAISFRLDSYINK